MADEVTVSAMLRLVNGELSLSQTTGNLSFDQTTATAIQNVQTIGFAAHEAVVLGDVASAGGYAIFKNLDATNHVQIGVDVAAVFKPVVILEPGQVALFPIAVTALYAQAAVANVKLLVFVCDL